MRFNNRKVVAQQKLNEFTNLHRYIRYLDNFLRDKYKHTWSSHDAEHDESRGLKQIGSKRNGDTLTGLVFPTRKKQRPSRKQDELPNNMLPNSRALQGQYYEAPGQIRYDGKPVSLIAASIGSFQAGSDMNDTPVGVQKMHIKPGLLNTGKKIPQ